MNKLLAALFASAFVLVAAPAFADDSSMKPLTKAETDKAKAERAAAKAKWDKMTPDEKAAMKKTAAAKKRADLTELEKIAQEGYDFDTKQAAKDAAASKAVPVPTKEQRQKDLTTLEKKAGPGQ